MPLMPCAAPGAQGSRTTRFTRLKAPARARLEVQRSVFLTVLTPVGSEDEARAVIEDRRREHHDARHHCTAFVLGPDRDVRRSSDDGEPSGTAGMPMLQALLRRPCADGSRDLTDVVAVTSRWFGGILLGAGGLIRAYSDAVSRALDAAETETWLRRRLLLVDVPMADAGRAEHTVRQLQDELGAPVLRTRYEAAGLTLTLGVPDDAQHLARARTVISASLGGRAALSTGEAVWAP